MNIKVSVIIPVYNVEPYLKECLDSVINQTLKEIEIICVDDFSPDNSHKILEEYAKKDNRVIVFTNEKNIGSGPTRNVGIKNAKGEYISFIDPDDYISNDFIETLYGTAKKYNSDITSTLNIVVFGENIEKAKNADFNCDLKLIEGKGKSNISIENEKGGTLEYMTVFAWNKIYKKDFLIKNDLFFMNIKSGSEDSELYQRILLVNKKTSYNRKAVYYHRKWNGSITSNAIKKNVNFFIDTISLMLNSIEFYKKQKAESTKYLYAKTFYTVLSTFNMNIYKDDLYKYLYDFTNQITLEKEISGEIAYAQYQIIKLNKEYKNYILYKKILDDINIYVDNLNKDLNKKNKIINTLVNKIVWFIPIRNVRDSLRKKILKYINS